MLIAEMIILLGLFFAICYFNTGTDDKNIKSYSSYPDEVQKIVRNNPLLSGKIKTSSSITSFISNVLLFTFVLLIFGFFIRKESFWGNFINLTILGQSLNLFDLLVIDLLWWRNSKRVRFSGTENMADIYRNPKKHIISFVKAIFVFLIAAIADGLILSAI